MSDFSENISAGVDELQGLIETEVSSIAASSGCGGLMEDAPHVLGQWVHSECTDVGALRSIFEDLLTKGDASFFFQDALQAIGSQFLITPNSPLEQFAIFVDNGKPGFQVVVPLGPGLSHSYI